MKPRMTPLAARRPVARVAAWLAALAWIAGASMGAAAPVDKAPVAAVATIATRPAESETVPPHSHVIVVVMENKSYGEVCSQPYTAGLIRESAVFLRSFAVAHPSQPNYLALWAANTMDVGDDVCPPAGSPYYDENLGHACEAAGLQWRSYAEDLPAPGSDTCRANGKLYTRKHDPWTDFANLSHANERTFADLAVDLARGTLPNLAFVIPNNCHNSHDSVCTAADADRWLSQNLPPMLQGLGPRGLLILTWDEDDNTDDNHILTVLSGPLVVATRDSTRLINHFSIVRTICDALGIPSFGNAADDSAVAGVWRPDPVLTASAAPAEGPWLSIPYPNPSPGVVYTRLRLVEPTDVTATVLDVSGRKIREIAHGRRVGDIALEWSGRDSTGQAAPPGVYVLSVTAGGRELERKILRLQ